MRAFLAEDPLAVGPLAALLGLHLDAGKVADIGEHKNVRPLLMPERELSVDVPPAQLTRHGELRGEPQRTA